MQRWDLLFVKGKLRSFCHRALSYCCCVKCSPGPLGEGQTTLSYHSPGKGQGKMIPVVTHRVLEPLGLSFGLFLVFLSERPTAESGAILMRLFLSFRHL